MGNTAGIKVREPQEMPEDFVIAKGMLLGEPDKLAAIQPQAETEFGNRLPSFAVCHLCWKSCPMASIRAGA